MDKPIQDAVDIAITMAARKEFRRLSRELPKSNRHVDVVKSVEESLHSLGKLTARDMPDYDEWDALFYPAWYQPKQVNLAYSVLRTLRENGAAIGGEKKWDGDIFGIDDGRAHFIDFGCGPLAMQFAVAIAAADSISEGRRLHRIRIDSYDPNPEMFIVGKSIWDEFVRRMKRHHPKHPICKVFDLIQCEIHAELDTLPEATDIPHFLSAIHAAYEESPVEYDLESLVAKYDPVGFLFTTRAHASNWKLLLNASPIREGARYARIPIHNHNLEARFVGDLDALTKWRRSLCDSLLVKRTLPPNTGINTESMKNLLNNPVTWKYPNPAILLYMRRDISEFTG